jgi:hypothetical protein
MAGLLPRVGLMLTGGTIDSVGTDRLDLAWYIEANKRLGDGELLLSSLSSRALLACRRSRSVVFRAKHWLIPTGSI